MSDEWLTPKQVAERLNWTVRDVRAKLRDGSLVGEKPGGRWRVRASEVEKYRTEEISEPTPSALVPGSEVEPATVEAVLPEKEPDAVDLSESQQEPEVEPGMMKVSIALNGIEMKGQWQIKPVEAEQIQSMRPSAPAPESPVPSLSKVDPGMVEVSIALAGIAVAIATFLPASELPENLKLIAAILAGITAVLSSCGALWLLVLYSWPRGRIAVILKRIDPYVFIGVALLFWLVLSVLTAALAVGR